MNRFPFPNKSQKQNLPIKVMVFLELGSLAGICLSLESNVFGNGLVLWEWEFPRPSLMVSDKAEKDVLGRACQPVLAP